MLKIQLNKEKLKYEDAKKDVKNAASNFKHEGADYKHAHLKI